jgi:hypothetical protein
MEDIPWYIIKYSSITSSLYLPEFYTSKNIPLETDSSRKINRTKRQVPGGATVASSFANMEDKIISFSFETGKYNAQFGIMDDYRFFDSLRKPRIDISGATSISSGTATATGWDKAKPFTPNPKVLYGYGAGSMIPQVYFVDDVKIKTADPNKYGYHQFMNVSITLSYDEANALNTAESTINGILSLVGVAGGISSALQTEGESNRYRKATIGMFSS